MRIRFVSQPFEDGFDARDFLLEVLRDPALTRLDIAVAWAKRSGLRIVDQSIRDFRDRGGTLRAVVGVDEGGATREGLEQLIELANQAYVYHLGLGRTFHPKVYLAYGPRAATLLTGSHNLTAGGLTANVEAGLAIEFDSSTSDGAALLTSVRDTFFERLIGDPAVCKLLNASTLTAILADSAVRVGDERFVLPGGNEEQDGASAKAVDGIFGASKHKLRSRPPRARNVGAPTASPTPTGATGAKPSGVGALTTPPTPSPPVIRRWFKEMSAADAQRPKVGTNPTGHLTFTQAGHGIDHRKYFRNVFFEGLSWRPASRGTGRVLVTIPVDVTIYGRPLGRHSLVVDHNPAYEAGQGNRTTTLHWGEDLSDYFRTKTHVGDVVTVERLEDDNFKIFIDKAATGPLIK
jgi:HKD family nuclease